MSHAAPLTVATPVAKNEAMRKLTVLERLWFWFRGRFLRQPLTELEHALMTRAHWYESENPARPWKASVSSENWLLAADDARATLTLVIGLREIGVVAQWPREWTLPGQEPGPLQVALMIAGLRHRP